MYKVKKRSPAPPYINGNKHFPIALRNLFGYKKDFNVFVVLRERERHIYIGD